MGCNPCYNGYQKQWHAAHYWPYPGCNPCYNGYQKQLERDGECYALVVILAIMDIKNNSNQHLEDLRQVVILAIMDIKNNEIEQNLIQI